MKYLPPLEMFTTALFRSAGVPGADEGRGIHAQGNAGAGAGTGETEAAGAREGACPFRSQGARTGARVCSSVGWFGRGGQLVWARWSGV